MLRTQSHRGRGATLALIAASTMLIGTIGVVCYLLLCMLGGSREGRHATDSGTLNVGKKSVLVTVDASSDENEIYGSLSDNGKYSLRSINRVWGKCFLTTLNQTAMMKAGHASSGSANYSAAGWNVANAISDRLSSALNDQQNLEPYFNELSHNYSLRMFSNPSAIAPTKNWQTACMNRGQESNMRIYADQLPPGINAEDLGADPVTALADGKVYLRGYYPLTVGEGKSISFVPFEFNSHPHLISETYFDAETLLKQPYPNWSKPVPNAFSCAAEATNKQLNQQNVWSSAALSHVEPADLRIANGFVRITLEQDQWKWFTDFIPALPFSMDVPKKATTRVRVLKDMITPLGIYTVLFNAGKQYYGESATVADTDTDEEADNDSAADTDEDTDAEKFAEAENKKHEVTDKTKPDDDKTHRTLYQALYSQKGHDAGMYSEFNKLLINRVNQIKPGTSWEKIENLLKATDIEAAGDIFFIAVNKDEKLVIAKQGTPQMATLNPDINTTSVADGEEFKTSGQLVLSFNAIKKVVHAIIFPPKVSPFAGGGTVWRHVLKSTPGTGVNGALLDVTQKDTTYAFLTHVDKPMKDPPIVSDDGINVTSPVTGCTCH